MGLGSENDVARRTGRSVGRLDPCRAVRRREVYLEEGVPISIRGRLSCRAGACAKSGQRGCWQRGSGPALLRDSGSLRGRYSVGRVFMGRMILVRKCLQRQIDPAVLEPNLAPAEFRPRFVDALAGAEVVTPAVRGAGDDLALPTFGRDTREGEVLRLLRKSYI